MTITLDGTTGITTPALDSSGPLTSLGIDDNATSTAITIDSSGRLKFGTTSNTPASAGVAGIVFGDNTAGTPKVGLASFSCDGAAPVLLTRLNSDGNILGLAKDGTTVGTIGVNVSGSLYINGTGNGYTEFRSDETTICALYSGGFYPVPDNSKDLGQISYRWDDIYATNGTIQTSDRNEKQDIDVMSEAETRVAVACKGLIRKFRWIYAVAKKGDDARIHFGIIAQDLQDAFAAEGLDAGRYAMFISSTWWEADRVVPAVEATDDTEAVAEHTVTDTYDTLEEAPEGATERTRLGVRYPELLAFIIGAL